jgi:hypothetical protein
MANPSVVINFILAKNVQGSLGNRKSLFDRGYNRIVKTISLFILFVKFIIFTLYEILILEYKVKKI